MFLLHPKPLHDCIGSKFKNNRILANKANARIVKNMYYFSKEHKLHFENFILLFIFFFVLFHLKHKWNNIVVLM